MSHLKICKVLVRMVFAAIYFENRIWAFGHFESTVPQRNPENVKGEGITPENLIISWDTMPESDQCGPGFYYRVYWKRDFLTHEWNIVDIINWEQNFTIIENQPIFVRFRIKVVAANQLGESNVTVFEKAAYSREGPLTGRPTNLIVTETTSKSAILRWDPISRKAINGHFIEYEIRIWNNIESNDVIRKIHVKNFYTSELLITALRANAINFVQIIAYNGKYQSLPSETIEIKTSAHHGTVQTFNVFPLGSSALLLRWTQPLIVDKLRGYKIYYEEVYGYSFVQSNPEWTLKIDNIQTDRSKLIDLKPNTKYRLHIAVMTTVGERDKYIIESKTNSNEIIKPDPPTFTWQLISLNHDNTTIKVNWLPDVDGSPGLNFFVKYRIKELPTWSSTDIINTDVFVIVSKLKSNNVYEFIVVSVDGEYTAESEIQEISINLEEPFLDTINLILIGGAAIILTLAFIFVVIVWKFRGRCSKSVVRVWSINSDIEAKT